ncbi:MAG: hypothetical protein C4536_06395 [Actinobacteria bacterium]|jgi:hypothetical protein|nr:MAG: hypothetical protein C4536_06395 [Actinomycetota bacterium]
MGTAERALRAYRDFKIRRLTRSISGIEGDGIGTFLARSVTAAKPRFFFSGDDLWGSSFGALVQGDGYVAAAETIMRHQFDLLGSGLTDVSVGMGDIRGERSSIGDFPGTPGGKDIPGARGRAGNHEARYGYRRIDWHGDFHSGMRWERDVPYTHVQIVKGNGSDINVPWELSRCQHLPVLGMAYRMTGEERYPLEFMHQVIDWIGANPPLRGVNWACPMHVAIRAVNWIWAYYLCAASPNLDAAFLVAFFRSLYVHGVFLRANLERPPRLTPLVRPFLENRLGDGTTNDVLRGLSTNHYLGDLVGLLYLGTFLSACREGRKWRAFATRELVNEMKVQVYPDGVDYEGSLNYHRLVCEFFLSATLLCLHSGISFPAWYMERLEKMVEFAMYYTRPDGIAPQIGDNDDGRLHILEGYGERDTHDHRHLLAVGAGLFARPDLAGAAGGFHVETLLLMGAPGEWSESGESSPPAGAPAVFREESPTLLPRTAVEKEAGCSETESYGGRLSSRSFPRGGYYIMRRSDLYMIVDCVPDDPRAPSGHKHNSRLSFELYAGDKVFIVDPGAYVYTADAEMRNAFRSTRYHNTVVVDGREQNEFPAYPLFNMGRDARVVVNLWEAGEDRDILDAEHHGYARLEKPVIHRRQILFLKRKGCWVVKDILEGEGAHRCDLYYHFAPMRVEPAGGSPLAVRTRTRGTDLAIIPLRPEGWALQIEEGWVSSRYGVRERAPVVRYRMEGEAPTTFRSVLHPFRGEIDIAEVAGEAANLAECLE